MIYTRADRLPHEPTTRKAGTMPRKREKTSGSGYSGHVPSRPGGGFSLNERGQRNYGSQTAQERQAADARRRRPAKKATPVPRKRTAAPTSGGNGNESGTGRAQPKKAARRGVRRSEATKKAAPAKAPAKPVKKTPTKATPPARKSAAPAKAAGKTIRKNAGTSVSPAARQRTPIRRTGRPGTAR